MLSHFFRIALQSSYIDFIIIGTTVMANTYTQLYIQLVFAVKSRASLIPAEHKEELHKYITGIVKNDGCKMLAINSMPDHIHIFFGLHPKIAIADLVRDIKANSSSFQYIQTQEEHHRKMSFQEEYVEFLKAFNIPYDERYVFQPIL